MRGYLLAGLAFSSPRRGTGHRDNGRRRPKNVQSICVDCGLLAVVDHNLCLLLLHLDVDVVAVVGVFV